MNDNASYHFQIKIQDTGIPYVRNQTYDFTLNVTSNIEEGKIQQN